MPLSNRGEMKTAPLVIVVDDDESVRESLPDLLRELGFLATAFASGAELLASEDVTGANCLILDIGMPGMSGPELQRELIRRGHSIPTIFITGRTNTSFPPELIKKDGIECLFKPFSEEELRQALDIALRSS